MEKEKGAQQCTTRTAVEKRGGEREREREREREAGKTGLTEGATVNSTRARIPSGYATFLKSLRIKVAANAPKTFRSLSLRFHNPSLSNSNFPLSPSLSLSLPPFSSLFAYPPRFFFRSRARGNRPRESFVSRGRRWCRDGGKKE